MKKVLVAVLCAAFTASPLLAQPFLLEQAGSIVKAKTAEIGIEGVQYKYDYTEIKDTTMKFTMTSLLIPIFARYGFTDDLEGTVTIPYLSLSNKVEGTGADSTTSDSQLSDIVFGIKKTLAATWKDWGFAAGGYVSLPTGSQSDKFAANFRNGLKLTPFGAASKQFGKIKVNANLSYLYNTEYEGKDKVKYTPSDVITVGAGAEMPCIKNENMTWAGEFIFKSLTEQKVAGTAVSGTSGTQMDLVLGGRYAKNDWKSQLGVGISLGEEKMRDHDWMLILGVTRLFAL